MVFSWGEQQLYLDLTKYRGISLVRSIFGLSVGIIGLVGSVGAIFSLKWRHAVVGTFLVGLPLFAVYRATYNPFGTSISIPLYDSPTTRQSPAGIRILPVSIVLANNCRIGVLSMMHICH